MQLPRTTIAQNIYPAVPSPAASSMLAMLFQLEQSQWWTPETIRHVQFRQLEKVLAHASATIPFYHRRLRSAGVDPAKPLDSPAWQRIPLLHRRDLQDNDLASSGAPPAHGRLHHLTTSGSTGQPVTVAGTDLTTFFWRIFTVREHLWHRRDFSLKLASIRTVQPGKVPAAGIEAPNWGPATAPIYQTGPSAVLDIKRDVDSQLDWLLRQRPHYLLTYPSNLAALLDLVQQRGATLADLRQVRTLGETVSPFLRQRCRDILGVKLVDMYSSQEFGYLALQCPGYDHYHVQAENVLLEVLDDNGTPCRPGEIGRIVISSLHNFAMPLIRYEIRDYAEVGEPCSCGRGLPVIRRLVGRRRNMLTLPGGGRKWPLVGFARYPEAAPIRQFQFIQKQLDTIEARLVPHRPLTREEETKLRQIIREALGYPFRINFTYMDEIVPGPGNKYEEFISEINT